jgi:hypothetical protein
MSRWKRFSLFLFIAVAAGAAACVIGLLLTVHPSEIERVFDGTEAVFVEGHNLSTSWHDLSRTDYIKSGAYRGLSELPLFRGSLGSAPGNGAGWVEKITPDAVMSAVGDECALGVYLTGERAGLLLVSRVEPNFLLMDRILALLGSDAGVVVSPYRGTRVKRASLGAGHNILWSLDGNLLILSDNSAVFYAALDRHIDNRTGSIVWNRAFRRMKRNRSGSELISGYAVTGRIVSMPGFNDAVPSGLASLLPAALTFSLSYEGGAATLTLNSAGGLFPSPVLFDRMKKSVPVLRDDELAAVCVRGVDTPSPLPFKTTNPPVPEDIFPGLLPALFPGGFSAVVLGAPKDGGGPGIVFLGGSSPSFAETVAELRRETGLDERRATESGVDISVLERGGIPYLAWARRGDTTVVSDRPDLLLEIDAGELETCPGFRYNISDRAAAFILRPRRIYSELARSAGPVMMPFSDLSLDQQRRLFAALYPADLINGDVSLTGRKLRVEVDIYVEDAVP